MAQVKNSGGSGLDAWVVAVIVVAIVVVSVVIIGVLLWR